MIVPRGRLKCGSGRMLEDERGGLSIPDQGMIARASQSIDNGHGRVFLTCVFTTKQRAQSKPEFSMGVLQNQEKLDRQHREANDSTSRCGTQKIIFKLRWLLVSVGRTSRGWSAIEWRCHDAETACSADAKRAAKGTATNPHREQMRE